MSLGAELVRRRVLPSLGLYLAGAWIAVEFSNWAEERYLLSPHLTDIILLSLVCMLPAWIMFCWIHGAPGKDRWHRAEKIGIPLNAMATVGILWMAFAGKDFGAAAQAVTITDELGETQQLVVPRESYRKNLGVFFWSFTGNSDDAAWLQYGFPLMLGQDLEQDPFIRVLTPYSAFTRGIYAELKRAGFVSGSNVPVSLMARIATNYGMDHFVRGSFREQGTGYSVSADLYQVTPTRTVASFEISGDSAMDLMDQLSVEIRDNLDLPAISDSLGDDLPIREHLTQSMPAVKLAVDGANAMMIENDYGKAIEFWNQALALDPAFALVAQRLGEANFMSGDTEAATKAYRQALQHDYRLQETDQYIVKSMDYFLRGEIDKRLRLLEMWAELSPENPDARMALADVYALNDNRYPDAIEQLEIAAELMPNEARVYQGIGMLQVLSGEEKHALLSLERYVELRPDDPDGLMDIGRLYERRGDLTQAQEYFERAGLISDDRVDSLVALSRLAKKQGLYEEVSAKLDEAESLAVTPSDLSKVLMQRIRYFDRLGMLRERLSASREMLRVSREFRSPIEIVLGYQSPLTNSLALLGMIDEATALLEESKATVGPPLDQFVAFGYADLYLHSGDLTSAEEQIETAAQLVEQFNQNHLAFLIANLRAEVAFAKGDYETAALRYKEAAESYQTGLAASAEPGAEALFLAQRSRALRHLGLWQALEETLHRVFEIDPANPLAHLQRGHLQLHRGDLQAAKESLAVAEECFKQADPEFELNADLAELRAAVLHEDP